MKISVIILVALILLLTGCTTLDNLMNGIDQKKVRDCQEVSNYKGEYIGRSFNEGEQGNCFIKLAKEEKNSSYCEFIPDLAREEDHSEPAMVYYNYHKDKCYYELAIEINDKTLCKKISEKTNDNIKEFCYSHFENN